MNVAGDDRTEESSHRARAGTLTLLSVAASAGEAGLLEAMEATFSRTMPVPSYEFAEEDLSEEVEWVREELQTILEDIPPVLAESPAFIRAHAELPHRAMIAERRFVASTLERWLGNRPDGALGLDREGGPAVATLACGWAATVTHALASEPRTLAQLDAAVGSLGRDALAEYLRTTVQTGQIEELDEAGEGRYGLTAWGRESLAPIVAAVRCEARHPDKNVLPPDVLDVEAAFQLVLPLLQLPTGLAGSCRLGVRVPEGGKTLAGATAEVADGRVASSSPLLEKDPLNWATGSPLEWMNTVVDPHRERVEAGGDLRLARSLLTALHETLFGAPLG